MNQQQIVDPPVALNDEHQEEKEPDNKSDDDTQGKELKQPKNNILLYHVFSPITKSE